VETRYDAAKAAHALIFSVTELTIVKVSGLPVCRFSYEARVIH